jgi:hypothetical protein
VNFTDEPIWQGATGGLRIGFARRFGAELGASGGPMLGHVGQWWSLSPSLMAKPVIGEAVRFLLSLGSALTVLDYDAAERIFWLEELAAHAELQAGEKGSGGWLGFDYRVPWAWGPRREQPDPNNHQYLEPPVRLSFQLGGVVSLHDTNWSLFAHYTVLDRGDWDRPATRLPILDGGFDQQQAVFGVQYAFVPEPPHERRQGI